MLWAIEPMRRSGLRHLGPADTEYLRHGVAYFGRLERFDFECPGCGRVYQFGLDEKDEEAAFDFPSQQFRCQEQRCRTVLNLMIVAEAPPRTRGEREKPMRAVSGMNAGEYREAERD